MSPKYRLPMMTDTSGKDFVPSYEVILWRKSTAPVSAPISIPPCPDLWNHFHGRESFDAP